ncbi:MAG TPA: MBL fold metallo-hydrolase [Actinomycetota bacterium]|nr:MBL fold metallo-hydrolase [Actinomycetota bacterium]
MSSPNIIDTKMHGLDEITATFLVPAARPALIETGPRSCVDNVIAALATAGVDSLEYIIVTHIHLDHAGAAGTLAAHFPDATVCVHEVGAPHLVDPSKLWASASRIYGAAMETMWGGIDPIDRDRIRVIGDGDTIDLGDVKLNAIETPGHAYHHHAYFNEDTGDLFTGDALGIFMQHPRVIRPATPPPELHVEKAVSSIERLRKIGAVALYFTHFGRHDANDVIFNDAIEALRRWEDWVRAARRKTRELDEVVTMVEAESVAVLEGELPQEEAQRLENTTSYRMNVMGFMRYLDKLEASR